MSSTLANLNLRLYHASELPLGTPIASSLSAVDNVELVYQAALAPGNYALVVENTSTTATPFALAWHSLPAVTVAATIATASEINGQTGVITITRTGDTTLPLYVPLTLGGTAISGSHYAALPANVTIPAGQTTTTLPNHPGFRQPRARQPHRQRGDRRGFRPRPGCHAIRRRDDSGQALRCLAIRQFHQLRTQLPGNQRRNRRPGCRRARQPHRIRAQPRAEIAGCLPRLDDSISTAISPSRPRKTPMPPTSPGAPKSATISPPGHLPRSFPISPAILPICSRPVTRCPKSTRKPVSSASRSSVP